MAIGDDLFTLLGLVPSRDRAGIARGTMADEAKASVAANSGNAEGRALIDQGARPPDFELPADIPTAYAAGRGPIRAAPYGGSGVISSVMPPPPSERVVASGPAAAPPPEVVRNSEILLEAHRRQAQAARMQQIIGSIGMIVNGAFNRNPDSQAATRQSLGAMVAGGGGAGGGGLPDLKTLLEMRDAETNTERMVDQAKRMFGLSEQDARARAATGELTKLFDPKTIATREADQRAGRVRMDLSDPAVIAEIAKRTGSPEAVVKADIANGKIGQKELTDILKDQAATGKLKAETRETTLKSDTAEGSLAAYMRDLRDPESFMKREKISDPNNAAQILAHPETYKEYVSKPWQTSPKGQAMRAIGADPGKFKEVAEAESTREPASAKGAEDTRKIFTEKVYTPGVGARYDLETTSKQLARAWTPDMVTGTAAGLREPIRRAVGFALGADDATLSNTANFNSLVKRAVIEASAAMKGAPSDRDAKILEAVQGGKDLSTGELRGLVVLTEKGKRAQVAAAQRELERLKADSKVGERYSGMPDIPMPEPSVLLKADIMAPTPNNTKIRTELEAYAAQHARIGDAKTQEQFNKAKERFDGEFGEASSDWYLAQKKG